MALCLRNVIHPQAHDNYRVILKLDEGDEVEVGQSAFSRLGGKESPAEGVGRAGGVHRKAGVMDQRDNYGTTARQAHGPYGLRFGVTSKRAAPRR